jgi:hypothetical protein
MDTTRLTRDMEDFTRHHVRCQCRLYDWFSLPLICHEVPSEIYLFFFLQDATHYSNYDYLICTLCAIFVFVPANRMWALDPKIRLAKKSQTISYWTLLLLRFIIALVYIFAGVSKMNEDSIRGMPILHWLERNPRRLNMFKQPLFAIWLSWSDLLVNLISPFLFLVGREYVYRLYACLVACG